MTETTSSPQASGGASPLHTTRALLHLIAVVFVTAWGFLGWELPLPGILVGIGAFVLSLLVWALFLSPKPVLHTDRFGQALIELLLVAAGIGAMLAIGVWWWIAVLYGLVAVVVGYITSMRGA